MPNAKTIAVAEHLTIAEQTALQLVSDIQQAHKLAAEANPVLALLLVDVLSEAAHLQVRLKQIAAVAK